MLLVTIVFNFIWSADVCYWALRTPSEMTRGSNFSEFSVCRKLLQLNCWLRRLPLAMSCSYDCHVERVMTINYSWLISSLYELQSLTQFEIWFQKLEFKWIVFHLVCDTTTGSSLFILKPNNYNYNNCNNYKYNYYVEMQVQYNMGKILLPPEELLCTASWQPAMQRVATKLM